MRATKRNRYKFPEGRIIKAYRVRAKITQRNLGKDTDIPLGMIREYEQGRCIPPADRMIKIMRRLDIPADEFAAVGCSEGTSC